MTIASARSAVVAAAVLLGLAVTPARSDAAFITFNSVPSSGNPLLSTLDTDGFRFTSDHFHTIDSPGGIAVSNGTIYLASEGGSLGRAITMTMIGGGTFSLTSFDGAESVLSNADFPDFPNAARIRVAGTFGVGGSIATELTLDGLADGPGGVADFQTFNLVGFNDLTSVRFSGVNAAGAEDFGFSIDNLNTGAAPSAVPAPAGLLLGLLGLGSCGIGGLARRRLAAKA